MAPDHPPHWGTVWLSARAAGGNPQAAQVGAGQCTAAEVAASEPAGRSRPPPGEPPRRRLQCHEGLAPEHNAPVESELSARASPSPAPSRPRRSSPCRAAVHVVAVGPGPRDGPPGDVGDRAGDGTLCRTIQCSPGPELGIEPNVTGG
jgi:hypothetical protein